MGWSGRAILYVRGYRKGASELGLALLDLSLVEAMSKHRSMCKTAARNYEPIAGQVESSMSSIDYVPISSIWHFRCFSMLITVK